MSKYVTRKEQEKMFLEEVNKIGVVKCISMVDGKYDYYMLMLSNGITRYWKTKDSDFDLKLRKVEVE
jgi:hypothetical protein